jgi:hypothetical protein
LIYFLSLSIIKKREYMKLNEKALERMDGLVNPETTRRLQGAIASITMALVADGFDAEDIEEFIGQHASWVVSDVIDDLA